MRFFALFAAFLCFLPVSEARENIFTLNREFTAKELSIDLKNINDVGFIFVSHEDESLVLAGQAEWGLSLTGLAGKGEIDLAPHLEDGENFVLFVLWNKAGKTINAGIYKRTLMQEWSCELALYGDGTNLYKKADKGEGGLGVVSSFAFNVDKHGSSYELTAATHEQTAKVARRLSKVNNSLSSKPTPDSNTDIASMLSVALTGGI